MSNSNNRNEPEEHNEWNWLIGRSFSIGEVVSVFDGSARMMQGDDEFRIQISELMYLELQENKENTILMSESGDSLSAKEAYLKSPELLNFNGEQWISNGKEGLRVKDNVAGREYKRISDHGEIRLWVYEDDSHLID